MPTDPAPEQPLEEKYRALEADYNQLRRALNASIAGIIVLDPEMNITFVNAEFLHQTLYTAPELLGKNFVDVFSPKNKQSAMRSLFTSARINEEKISEMRCLDKQQNRLYLWAQIRRLNEQEKMTGYSVATRNITEQKKQEEQISKMNTLMVDREIAMQELKKQLEACQKQLSALEQKE